MKSRGITILLAIVLGGIGGHKFYLGNILSGVMYALFCWTGIPIVLAIIDIIILLLMSDQEFNLKYNNLNQ